MLLTLMRGFPNYGTSLGEKGHEVADPAEISPSCPVSFAGCSPTGNSEMLEEVAHSHLGQAKAILVKAALAIVEPLVSTHSLRGFLHISMFSLEA